MACMCEFGFIENILGLGHNWGCEVLSLQSWVQTTESMWSLGIVMQLCNLSAGMAETGILLGLVASQSNGLTKL